jgi:hypothetical protein
MNNTQTDQQAIQELRNSLVIEQYRSLRDEVIQRVLARQQTWSVLILVAGSFLAVGLQPGIAAWTLLLYPIIALFFAINWAHNETRIDQITWYIQHQVEGGLQFVGWETYRSATFRRKRRAKQQHPLALMPGLNALSARGVFASTQLLATTIGAYRLAGAGITPLAVGTVIIELVVITATFLLLVDRKAQATEKANAATIHSEQQPTA